MIQDTEHEPLPQASRDRAIWVLFLAGPVIWLLHFMGVYLLGEVLCTAAPTDVAVAGLPLVSFVTVVATVLAAVGVAIFTVLAYRRWQGDGDSQPDAEAADRGPTLAFAGVLLGVLFFVGVLFTGAPALVLQPC